MSWNVRADAGFLRNKTALGYGYIGAKNDTTQQSGQTPDQEVKIKNITVYVSGYTETDMTGMLSPATVWCQHSEFVSSRQSGQILAAVCIGVLLQWTKWLLV
jgi:O-glycosyl hydrolase